MKKPAPNHKRKLRHNLRPAILVLALPILGLAIVGWMAYASITKNYQVSLGAIKPQDRSLVNAQAQAALNQLTSTIGDVERQFSYYKVKKFETVDRLSMQFGVPVEKIESLNPGPILPGLTIKIPPVQAPLSSLPSNYRQLKNSLRIAQKIDGVIEINGRDNRPLTILSVADLADYTSQYGMLEKVTPRHWRLKKTVLLDTNIRLQITKDELEKFELRSDPNNITCLCLEDAQLLIDGVNITSYDSANGGPDKDPNDQRSYIRARRSSRMDILNADISYLGNGIMKNGFLQQGGGTYGVSWRIPDERYGVEIATGWVENSKFHHNYIGNFTFGASGMMYRGNHYYQNDYYGLDPHDDSNNAMVENNLFENNGKHGFIVSKRCKYNIIRNNISRNNTLHGYMLHADSHYNLIEDNIAENNVDNIAIYQSSHNIVRRNKLLNPRKSNVRVNRNSNFVAITDNVMNGGRAVALYDSVKAVLISANKVTSNSYLLTTNNNVSDVVVAYNTASQLAFKIKDSDRIINKPNNIAAVQ